MAVKRAINYYKINSPDLEDAVIIYKPRSDFIKELDNPQIKDLLKLHITTYPGCPKKKGFVIVVIVAPKIIFKLAPIFLDINVPYSKVILGYCGGFCNEWFDFYGYFGIRGFRYFAKMMKF